MLFSCVGNGIKHRFIDVSHQAVESRYFPVSVGLRSQALKLKFVTPEIPGRFLKPTQPFKKVIEIFERRFNTSVSGPVFHSAQIGETLSMIYSPFYFEKKIYDAILNRPVSAVVTDDFDPEHLAGGKPGWRTRFIPAMCPGCGWDLEGERDALVLNCRNCATVWRPAKNAFKQLKFAHIPGQGDDRVMFFPFWRIKTKVSGIELESYADLVKIANLPKAFQPDWQDVPFYFWTPAFKVRPEAFLRLTNHITLSQPQKKLVDQLPDTRLYPVTLPIEEAFETLILNLAGFVKPKTDFLPRLSEIKIIPERFLLVYVPFNENHLEFIQPEFHLTLNKNHLALSANL